MRSAPFSILLIPALLWSCVAPPPESAPEGPSAATASAARGLAFAEAQCSGCHSVERGQSSLNPQAPTFEAVANELDFTPGTLREFFLDGHDTPAQMSLQLEEDEAEAVTDYIMSLRKPR